MHWSTPSGFSHFLHFKPLSVFLSVVMFRFPPKVAVQGLITVLQIFLVLHYPKTFLGSLGSRLNFSSFLAHSATVYIHVDTYHFRYLCVFSGSYTGPGFPDLRISRLPLYKGEGSW
jgi:hypothetical protein